MQHDSDSLSKGQMDQCISKVEYELGKASIRMVEMRYESLLSSASHLVNCISIISIAVVTSLPFLYSYLPERVHMQLTVSILIVLGCLIIALLLALTSRLRFSYMILDSPKSLCDQIQNTRSEFNDESEFGQFFSNCLAEHYETMQKRSDKISVLVQLSNMVLIAAVSLVVLLVAGLILAVNYC